MRMQDIEQSKEIVNEKMFNALRKFVPESEVSFSHKTEYCCVALVDIVNSTNITSRLSNVYACMYYDIFLNMMSSTAKGTGGVVVKNIGDSLLIYYPATMNSDNNHEFGGVLESLFKMINIRDSINAILSDNNLPEVSYRISCDCGEVMMANSSTSNSKDIFGSTVSYCTKMNRLANPNEIIIGGDLYQSIKNLDGFVFAELKKQENPTNYSVYSLKRS